jgi:hypothetical protein
MGNFRDSLCSGSIRIKRMLTRVVFHFLPAMLKFALENKLQVPDKVLKAIKALGGK